MEKAFEIYKVAIIGGGASGLMLASFLKKNCAKSGKKQIILFEANDRVGKKLAITGNGQGNITNARIDAKNFHSENENFFMPALNFFDNKALIEYFAELGVLTSRVNDKVYFKSKRATDVVDVLREDLEDFVSLKLSTKVSSVKKEKELFEITAGGEKYFAENLVLATGGKSYSRLGSDGNGYLLAENFGHGVTKLYPSLVQLKTKTDFIKNLRGIKCDAKITAKSNGKKILESQGEILFTEYGVSGPAIFSLSGIASFKNVVLEIDFFEERVEDIEKLLKKRVLSSASAPLDELFIGTLNKQISRAVLKKNNIEYPKLNISSLCGREREIANAFKNFSLVVTGNMGFENAQVTRGGVDTKSVCPNTLESKLCKNLYFIGEILDVDGDCGGYNLQWAFSSASLVANEILKEQK